MEMQIVETVLTDLLEEQKETNKLLRELIEKLNEVEIKVDGFNQKLENQQVMPPPVDTRPLEKIAALGMVDMCQVVAKQPKSVIKQFRLQLFPETNSDRYYKIILPWALLFVIATYIYFLIKQWMGK